MKNVAKYKQMDKEQLEKEREKSRGQKKVMLNLILTE